MLSIQTKQEGGDYAQDTLLSLSNPQESSSSSSREVSTGPTHTHIHGAAAAAFTFLSKPLGPCIHKGQSHHHSSVASPLTIYGYIYSLFCWLKSRKSEHSYPLQIISFAAIL